MTAPERRGLQEDCARSAGDDIRQLTALKKCHVVITGGTGFAGSWLAEMISFLNDEHEFGIRLSLVAPHAHDFRERAPHLAGRADVMLTQADVRNMTSLPSDTDWIIHGAGSPDRRVHFSNPVQTVETIVSGTQAVMNAASRLSALQGILCLSSGLVYGAQKAKADPAAEKGFAALDCNSLSSVYAESKRAAEMVTAAFRSQYGLPVLNARLFAFIGPYQLLDRPWAVNNFLSDALRGGPIRVQGTGDTVRSYMYGSDLAFWLLRILVSGKSGSAYNVGSPEGIKLRDLAARIAACPAKRAGVELNTLPTAHAAESTQWLPDVSLVAKDFGLGVRLGLDEAIDRTFHWHAGRPARNT